MLRIPWTFSHMIICNEPTRFALYVEDVNECNADIYPCHEDAFCNNTIGSYDCICEDGFDGNGTICAG